MRSRNAEFLSTDLDATAHAHLRKENFVTNTISIAISDPSFTLEKSEYDGSWVLRFKQSSQGRPANQAGQVL
jgi:hypothetical protein